MSSSSPVRERRTLQSMMKLKNFIAFRQKMRNDAVQAQTLTNTEEYERHTQFANDVAKFLRKNVIQGVKVAEGDQSGDGIWCNWCLFGLAVGKVLMNWRSANKQWDRVRKQWIYQESQDHGVKSKCKQKGRVRCFDLKSWLMIQLTLAVLQVLFRLNSLDFEIIPHSRGTRRNVSSLKFLKKIWKSLLPVVRTCLIFQLVDQNLIAGDVGSGPVGLCVKAGILLGQIMFYIYTRVVNQLTRLRTMSNCYTNQLAFEWHVKKPVHWPKIEKLRENW